MTTAFAFPCPSRCTRGFYSGTITSDATRLSLIPHRVQISVFISSGCTPRSGTTGSQHAVRPHLTLAAGPELQAKPTSPLADVHKSYVPRASHLRSTFNLSEELLDTFPPWLPHFTLPAARKRTAVPGTERVNGWMDKGQTVCLHGEEETRECAGSAGVWHEAGQVPGYLHPQTCRR